MILTFALATFAMLSLSSHATALLCSAFSPMQPREASIAIWPPAPPFAAWFERVWSAPLDRWDVAYYARIAQSGYRPGDGTTQFHPLYPLLARPAIWVGIPPAMALLLTSSASLFLLVPAFYRLAKLELEADDARFATISLLASPFAFALSLPYPEAVFLLFAVLTVYFARTDRWVLSGVMAALATLTRQQGILLALPLVWMAWQRGGGQRQSAKLNRQYRLEVGTKVFAVAAAPLSYLGWSVYRALAFGELGPDSSSLHDLIYTLFISPHAVQVVPVQTFLWPWAALGRAIRQFLIAPDVDIIVNLVGSGYYLVLLALAWSSLSGSNRLYTLATTAISFAYHTGPVHPYMGLLRHLLLGFPVFIGLATSIDKKMVRLILVGLGFIGRLFLVLLYCLHTWVP